MDFDLMITSFPKLLSATAITLKLLSVSLLFGLFIGLLRQKFRDYSLKDFGGTLDVSAWKFWRSFGLKRGDIMDFKIYIRTFDASDDCTIRGKYKANNLTHLTVHGKGEKCSSIKDNNKL